MTQRQYQTWQMWLAEQWNQPDRTDHYLMRIAWESHWNGAKNAPSSIDLKPYRIPFREQAQQPPAPTGERKPGEPPRPLTKEDILGVRKAMTLHRVRQSGKEQRNLKP